MEPGSIEWIDAKITEYEAAKEQALAYANSNAGAALVLRQLKAEKLAYVAPEPEAKNEADRVVVA